MRRLVAGGVLLVVAACGTSEPGDPGPSTRSTSSPSSSPQPRLGAAEAAVAALMRALDEGDCTAAKRLVVTASELGCDVVEQSAGSFADEGIDLDEVVYRAGPVNGSSSTVRITWGNGYPTESYDVERVDGRWKVVFDSAA